MKVERNLTGPGVSRWMLLTLEEAKDAAASADSLFLFERTPYFATTKDVYDYGNHQQLGKGY
jgi:hypothetical protein